MSERTQNLDKFLREKYAISDLCIVSKHAEIQQKITSMDEFNEHYKSPAVVFSNSSKTDILRLHSEFSCVLTQSVITINNTRKRRNWLKQKKV